MRKPRAGAQALPGAFYFRFVISFTSEMTLANKVSVKSLSASLLPVYQMQVRRKYKCFTLFKVISKRRINYTFIPESLSRAMHVDGRQFKVSLFCLFLNKS